MAQEQGSIRNILHQAEALGAGTASHQTLAAARPVTAGRDPRCSSDAPVIKSTRCRHDDGTPRHATHARAAVVFRDICPVQWTGRQAVIAFPEHIDVSNAGPIREELLSVINRGAQALIADLTATISCDHAGADALVRTYHRALMSGAELRLVVTAPIVRQMLSLAGLDRLVPIYPSLMGPPPPGRQRQ